jgi:hypothetical protein
VTDLNFDPENSEFQTQISGYFTSLAIFSVGSFKNFKNFLHIRSDRRLYQLDQCVKLYRYRNTQRNTNVYFSNRDFFTDPHMRSYDKLSRIHAHILLRGSKNAVILDTQTNFFVSSVRIVTSQT